MSSLTKWKFMGPWQKLSTPAYTHKVESLPWNCIQAPYKIIILKAVMVYTLLVQVTASMTAGNSKQTVYSRPAWRHLSSPQKLLVENDVI